MKNKIYFFLATIFISTFGFNNLIAEKFLYEAEEININQNGNIIKGKNNVKIKIGDDIEIYSDEIEYNKENGLAVLKNNIFFFDKKNNIKIKTDKIFYSEINNKIFSDYLTEINYNENYFITLENIEFDLIKDNIMSKGLSKITDKNGNYYELSNFEFNINSKNYRGSNLLLRDKQKNLYYIENILVNTQNNNIYGKDLNINFNKNFFGNSENDPRISARSIEIDNNSSFIKKGIFTTCKKNDDCPPWTISSEEIEHDKNNQIIKYKNAWLRVYDYPIAYFPKFSHPDPTVKKKSGFLIPKISNSNILGSSVKIPYYHLISENKDLTLNPNVYFNDDLVLQAEYRQANKNSNHIVDTSINPNNYLSSNNYTKGHFFSNSEFNFINSTFNENQIELNLQKTNNDEYLKLYKIDSANFNNNSSSLHSYLKYYGSDENLNFSASLEVYEDLTKPKSDRYEFIYPNYLLQKDLNVNDDKLILKSSGNQKKYETNKNEKILINDLIFEGSSNYTANGFENNLNFIIKNVNSDGKNSNTLKEDFESSLSSLLQYNMQYPLEKENFKFIENFTPRLSLMYSPNKSKNLYYDKYRIDTSNIFSFNRISNNETVEGGASMTVGVNYKKNRQQDDHEVFQLNLATSFRPETNLDLPKNSSLGQKTSDIFGSIDISPISLIDLKYNFAVDNNLNKSNYDSIQTRFSINRFVTTFEYLNNKLEDDNSYTFNNTSLEINNSSSVDFNVRRNNNTSATEFYNLIYNYKNDCLIASVGFNKEFYQDADLKPETQIFLSLSIVPFGSLNTFN